MRIERRPFLGLLGRHTMWDVQKSPRGQKWAGMFRRHALGTLLSLIVLVLGSLAAEPDSQQPIPNPMNQQSRGLYDGFGDKDTFWRRGKCEH